MKLLFLLLVFFIPTQFGLHFWPDFAFINGIRIDYFSPTIYTTDLIIVAILLLSFRAKRGNLVAGLKRLLRSRWLLAMTLWMLLNIYFSISPILSFYKWLKVFEFLFLILLIKDNFKKEWLNDFLKLVAITIIFQSSLGFFQFLNQHSLGGLFYFFGERTFNASTPGIALGTYIDRLFLRPYGTLPHPNLLAAVLLFYVIILIKYFQRSATIVIAIITGVVGIILTVSRLGYAAFVIAAVAVFVPKYFSKFFGLTIIFAVLYIFVFDNPSISIRENLNSAAIKIIGENFLFGTGLGTNIIALQKYSRELFFNPQPLAFLQPVHNIYLLILSETGIVGFIFAAFSALKIIFKSKLFFVILFLGIFDHYFYTLQSGQLLLCFVIGIILSCQNSSDQLPQTLPFKFSEK